jgi:hypothetical protein
MFWITKYKHNKIVVVMQKNIDDLREALWRKKKLEEICEKLTDKVGAMEATIDIGCGQTSVMDQLDDSIPQYVDDYFGGRVIKQEATSVTILDSKGHAKYGLTKKKPKKGEKYILYIDPNN